MWGLGVKNQSVMTPEEVAEYCRQAGIAAPSIRPNKLKARSRLALELGEAWGHSVITIECPPERRGQWYKWLRDRQLAMGGDLKE